ncbi:MAG: TIM barrel protein [Armatimonadetes bacterium]|nr:TIM barrel protein [Armatimonadota bacterium]
MGQLKLSVCIEMLFNQLDILDRPAAVAEVGLPALEFWGWKNKDVDAIKARADAAGVKIAGFCVVADAPLVNPETTTTWVEGAKESILEARRVGVPTLIATTGQEMEIPRQAQHDAVVAGLKAVAPFAEEQGITLVLEPLNVLTDHKGYFLVTSDEGFEIIGEVASPRVKLLFDIYHQQISEGNLIVRITSNIDKIGHFHVADVPGRFEPGTGEINYTNVFARMAELDYAGYVGLEFRPSTDPATALKQVKAIAGV